MKLAATLLSFTALLAITGCGKRAKGPDWAISAPPGVTMALSGQAGWVIQQQDLQKALEHYPMANQALDVFLKRARINPQGETGRITFYAMNLPLKLEGQVPTLSGSNFLIQLGGFRDPKSLLVAISEAFPTEGTLQTPKGDLPLHVLFDYNQFHMRLVFDSEDRIWIGDLAALGHIGQRPAPTQATLRATEWIDAQAPIQGLVRTEGLLKEAAQRLPVEIAKELPAGIEVLAWSVSPSPAKDAPHQFALVLTGTPEGVQQASPWVQRLVALMGALPNAPSRPADVLEERTRVGLRAQLSNAQLEAVMSRLSQPGAFPSLTRPKPKP